MTAPRQRAPRFNYETRHQPLTPKHTRILELVQAEPGILRADMARRLDLKPYVLAAALETLQDQGYVHQRRTDETPYRLAYWPGQEEE